MEVLKRWAPMPLYSRDKWRPGRGGFAGTSALEQKTITLKQISLENTIWSQWMRVGIDSLLSSIWCSEKNSNSTKCIKLYSGVSEQLKPLQPIGQAAEFKFESKIKPLLVIWQSLLKAISEDNQSFLTAKSMAKLLGQRSGTAWACQRG